MSVFNSERYLKDAVESILSQTYKNFEFIIIDDGSSDSSLRIIKSYKDKRIRLIENKVNIGLAASLNKGLVMATGKYIARMDSDDISMPDRLERQFKYMESHPDVICYGSWARYFGSNLPKTLRIKHSLHLFDTFRVPLNHNDIQASLLFWIPFVHPTVMFNASLLKINDINYNPQIRRAQDYELWSRLCFLGKCANSSKILLKYRISATNAGSTSHDDQLNVRREVVKGIVYKLLGRLPTAEELTTHMKIVEREINNKKYLYEAKKWLNLLASKAKENLMFDQGSLIKAISAEWRRCCAATFPFPKNMIEYISVPTIGKLRYITLYDWLMFIVYKLFK